MTESEPIDIRRGREVILICGVCGTERRMPPDWRKIIQDTLETGEWDGVLRCQNEHPPAPMHAFAGMDHEDGPPQRWRGTCECGHTEVWAKDKDTAWQEIAAHLLIPLNAAIARRQGATRTVLSRFICIHNQRGTRPCPEGCHGPHVQRTADGWTAQDR